MESNNSYVIVACGSFSPITTMHLRMMECAREVVWEKEPKAAIVGVLSPVNDAYGKKGLAESKHRVEMCKLATVDSNWIFVDDWESNQPTHQETIKVLDNIAENFPDSKLMLVCGSDLLQSFNTPGVWEDEDIKRILQYGIIVISRPGTPIDKIIENNEIMKNHLDKIWLFNNPHINNLSSTYVRSLVKNEKSIKYLVTHEVEEYIYSKGLFKD